MGEVARLERRLAKVKSLLEVREDELRRIAALEQAPRLPPIHDGARVLGGAGALARRKRLVMASILEANLELQRRLDTDR